MSKLQEKIDLYTESAEKLSIAIEADLFKLVAKGLGPSIYKEDSELVSSSNQAELETVKKNFLIKKLGLEKDDAELDLPGLKKLLKRVEREIHRSPNDDVRYTMNNFVIAVGSCVESLSELALKTAEKIGEVAVDHGDTSCKTPFAPDYIRKIEKMGRTGKKRKSAKC